MDAIRQSHSADAAPRITRVVLTGSESVGKTTLAEALGAHYGVVVVPEFVRSYALEKGAPLGFGDHGPIARGQMALEDAGMALAQERGDTLLLCDTDLVSTVAYCHHYFGRCPEFLETLAAERRADLYLLLEPDVPWVADGVRDRGDRREEVQTGFRELLSRMEAKVATIRGNWTMRHERAIAAIDALLPSRGPHTSPSPSPEPSDHG